MTSFGKKTAAQPTFGKKVSPQAARARGTGGPAQAPLELSPKAAAFLEAERARNGQPANLPTVSSGAVASYTRPAASGFGKAAGKPVWGRRIIAILIDALVVGFPAGFLFGGAVLSTAAAGGEEAFAIAFITMLLLVSVVSVVYSVMMEASSTQATLGKMAVGVIVTDVNGGKPTTGAIIMRNTLGRLVSNLIPLYIGYLIGVGRQDRRCVHDLIAGTMVCTKAPQTAGYAEAFA